jgi:hypothetical protein
MQLTQESRGMRWLILFATWALCAIFIGLHTRAVNDHVRHIDGLGLRGALEAPTPMRHVIPTRYADGQMWVRHALAAQAAGETRVRFTYTDNAPHGREVHWAAPLSWILRTAGAAADIERVVGWLNAPILLAWIVLLSSWAARLAGAGAGVLVAVAMVGHNRFYDPFAPANVDHHGLVTAAVLGCVMGLVFMGAGWWKPNLGGTFATLLPSDVIAARRAAVVSALCGAFGLWISAAYAIPVIAITGIAGVLVALWRGHAAIRDGARFDPTTWRLWGRTGAALSLAFYLVEYAPANLALRLEVNHPIYALAWWGGAEIVATLGMFSVARLRAGERTRAAWRLILPVAAILAAPAIIVLGGAQVFAPGGPFLAGFRSFSAEGRSLLATVQAVGFADVAYPLASCLLLIPAIAMGWRARGEGATLLGFATLVAVAFIAMGFREMRWWPVASATQIALLLVVVAATRRKWLCVLAVSAFIFLPSSVERIMAVRQKVRDAVVDPRDLLPPVYRDIAAALRATQPEGDILLLASPDASMGIGYYGSLKTLGTPFWENAPGLKAAAGILCAPTDEAAAALIRARGVTHIAIISPTSFVSEYFSLLYPAADAGEVKKTFGYRHATKSVPAPWLQLIPYRLPPDLTGAGISVSLFKVAFEQTVASAGPRNVRATEERPD